MTLGWSTLKAQILWLGCIVGLSVCALCLSLIMNTESNALDSKNGSLQNDRSYTCVGHFNKLLKFQSCTLDEGLHGSYIYVSDDRLLFAAL